MSWFNNLFGGTLALQRRLRAAEQRLLALYAPTFATPVGDSTTTTTTTWQAVDTPIRRSIVPLEGGRHVDLVGHNNETVDLYTMHSIRVTSNREEDNQSNAKTAPLVLLHGYMNGGAYFYRNVHALSRYFGTVHAVDLLGWGLSSRPRWPRAMKMSPQAAEDFFVESLEAWRAAQKPALDRMVLTGHSMGGYLAIAYCERYPSRVERLILLSPVGVPPDTAERRAQQERARQSASWQFRALIHTWRTLFAWNFTPGHILRLLPTARAQRLVQGYLKARIPSIQQDDERHAVAEYLHLNSALPGSGEYWVTACLHSNLMAKQPMLQRIAKLRDISSITFLYGAHDWMDPVTGGLAVQEATAKNAGATTQPKVTVQVVDNAGHLLMLDHPQAVNAGIIAAGGGKAHVSQYFSQQEVQSVRTLVRRPVEEGDDATALLAADSGSS